MERVCFWLRLHPGAEAEYDRRHEAIWPELADAIRDSGLRNMSGFRRGFEVWYYLEAEPDAATALARLGTQPVNTRWNHWFRDVIAEMTGPDGSLIRWDEVFHANGGGAGPMERGLFELEIAPGTEAAYDERHANPWPDMVAAIDEAGIHNYSGFRRGTRVAYYGEFHPDLATAFAAIGATEVNRRWGESFAGIITRITDEDGNLLLAREVFHQA